MASKWDLKLLETVRTKSGRILRTLDLGSTGADWCLWLILLSG